ncbi:MAG: 23S rRNA (guanosine(2251)-2'-O)-methyltransferase RlmB [Lactobacillus sp.]|jgi:23S rRNA (guanosine2251-2'-O)-methyltransferase|nr:23S rRNA (guanosine(2251)-2'-O)-methyltransferase RlmB [Lactobacillus sp.]
MAKDIILYGRHAIMSALSNPNRKISKILCTKENFEELKKYSKNFQINIVDRKDIDKILPPNSVHQGFALYCKELDNLAIEDIISLAEEKQTCHLLILDQVTDPQNIGAIIRSCVAFNSIALIVQDKNSPQESGAMAKAAAGMLEHLPICRVTNLSRAIAQLKKADFWVIGMDGYAKTTVDKLKKGGKTAIVMGSEGAGMRRLVEENCDLTIKLPINPAVESLNVSTAAAIVLYEINKE